MEIYIDESGVFVRPAEGHRAISCVGALVLRSSEAPRLLERFARLRDRWGLVEISGRKLEEEQFAEVIALCRRYDPLLEIRATDTAAHAPEAIAAFKHEQGALLERHVTAEFKPEVRAEISDRRRYLEGMPDQLFLQLILLVSLADDVLREAIPYYALRCPEELGRFRWRVDAKDSKETEAERLWRQLMLGMLQAHSVRYPHVLPTEGDYSHFRKFDRSMPDYVKEAADREGLSISGDGTGMDLQKVVYGDFELSDSGDELGLQLADVLTSAVRRGMAGTLKRQGWKDIGRLMVSTPSMALLEPRETRRADLTITDSKVLVVQAEIDAKLKGVFPSRFSVPPGQIRLKT
jgi:hypothetical protein